MGIANIINNSTTTSGGEIVTELVNASDGAGLHLQSGGNIEIANGAAQFGTSDFSIEFILNQERENTSEGYIYVTHVEGEDRLLIFHDVSHDRIVLDFRDGLTSVPKNLDYDMNQDFGSPTHYVITFDRSGLATLYKNGNSVATVDISAVASIDIGSDTTPANIPSRIGTSGSDGVIGTFYRFRTWNKALTSAEVQTAFERADVDYADQYGSQGSPYTSDFSSGTDSFSSYGGAAVAHSGSQINITSFGATGRGIYRSLTFSEPNKKYRVKLTGSVAAGTKNIGVGIASAGADDAANRITLTTTPTTHIIEVTYPSGSQINVASQDTVDTTVSITSLVIEQIGCVSDYDLAFASPTQSLTVQDRAGAADGTCSASGVTQVQPVVQLNSTSARIGTSAATPADGELLVSGNLGVGCDPSRELEVSGPGNVYARITAQTANDSTALELKNTGGTWTIVNDDTDSEALKFKNGGSASDVRLTIDSTGLATFSNGINLGNTASATATTLDGYEEGTFTVTNNGDTSGVISSETGEYTRIGNCVFIRVAIRVGTTFANNRIGGLPFGCVTDGATSSWSPIGTALTGSATNAPILVAAQNGVANLAFFKQANTVTTHLPSTSEDYYRVTGYYYTTDAF